jgi:hypothetical protein
MRSPLEQGEQSVCDFNSFKGVNGQRSNWISRNKYEHTKKIRRVPRRENTDGHPFFFLSLSSVWMFSLLQEIYKRFDHGNLQGFVAKDHPGSADDGDAILRRAAGDVQIFVGVQQNAGQDRIAEAVYHHFFAGLHFVYLHGDQGRVRIAFMPPVVDQLL